MQSRTEADQGIPSGTRVAGNLRWSWRPLNLAPGSAVEGHHQQTPLPTRDITVDRLTQLVDITMYVASLVINGFVNGSRSAI